MNKDKLNILEKLNYNLNEAKEIYKWLTEEDNQEKHEAVVQNDDGISIHEFDGGAKGVRVKIFDEDFVICANDYEEDGKMKFNWNDAMEKVKAIGCTMWTKKQMYIVAAYIDEINEKLREIGGEELKGYYWSATEYSPYNAWLVGFGSGYSILNYVGKYSSLVVRPVAAF